MHRTDPKYIEAVRYLLDRINYEKSIDVPYTHQSYRLARMAHLLDLLDNPQEAAPVIHIAGTKGKGSVAWLVSETLRHSGLRTGLYTSPHLEFLEERFVLQGASVEPEQWMAVMPMLRRAAEQCAGSEHGSPTFFELTTALAWTLFREAKTDVNVIEVGLGGRLDSTNVCQPALCIITSISYDHQQQLGDTLAKIAGEKAGIIKPRVPVIHGVQANEARDVIRSVALSNQSPLWELGRDFRGKIACTRRQSSISDNEATDMDLSSPFTFECREPLPPRPDTPLRLRMLGSHQADNASLAVAAWLSLTTRGWNLTTDALAKALAETQVPARIECVSTRPWIVIDSAHNEASIEALLNTLDQVFEARSRTIIFACSKDKNVAEMLRRMIPRVDRLILTQYHSNPRFVPVERLEQLAREELEIAPRCIELFSAPDVAMALEFARRDSQENDMICVTGSFFTASEAKQALSNDRV
jgi:dihydrofolate synthase/folylpolyglutamate synthase